MKTIYSQHPQGGDVGHRVHASIAVIGTEWQLAKKERRPADLSKITAKALDSRCARTAAAYPQWPKILMAKDLSKVASEQPLVQQWWLDEQPAEDNEEGKCKIVSSHQNTANTPFSPATICTGQQGEGARSCRLGHGC